MNRHTRILRALALTLCFLTLLEGCAMGYYWQAASGQYALLRARRPIPAVIADPVTDSALRAKLTTVMTVVEFAHDELGLPDNGSYRAYADIERRYAVWNIVATPALSLQPRTWCFPIAGCVSYRGYFKEHSAHRFAAGLAADGDDVTVGGVAAYSTLGRFEDPVMNTMMTLPNERLAEVVFHELAHQLVYAPGDSQFNEGFASFIEIEGARRWLGYQGDHASLCAMHAGRSRRAQVQDIVVAVRAALNAVYGSEAPAANQLLAKSVLMAALPAAYQQLRSTWEGPPTFDGWFAKPFNNARLAALATYDRDVPAFAALLVQHGDDLAAFYAAAADLADLPADQRRSRLATLRRGGADKSREIACSGASESATAGLARRGAGRVSAGSDLLPVPAIP